MGAGKPATCRPGAMFMSRADGVYLQAPRGSRRPNHVGSDWRDAGGQEGASGVADGHAGKRSELEGTACRSEGAGLSIAPDIAVGDGALALEGPGGSVSLDAPPAVLAAQILNVLDKLPKSVQPNAHRDLREIWLSENRAAAEAAMTIFAEKYAPKYDKAVDCLLKNRDALLTFFDFPAEHWTHLRTSNPIESAFATVRHRTVRMKGALSQDTARLMVFKLIMAAAKSWRRLQGQNQLPKIVRGVTFRDEIEVASQEMSAA